MSSCPIVDAAGVGEKEGFINYVLERGAALWVRKSFNMLAS